jgi:thymidine phosphorylase
MKRHDSKPLAQTHQLKVKRLKLVTQDEAIVIMRVDCPICRSEGLSAKARVLLKAGERSVIATLYQVENDWLKINEAGLSEAACKRLQIDEGDLVHVDHAPRVQSLGDIRRRIYGNRLDGKAFGAIISDIASGHYLDIHLATFIATCSAFPLNLPEITHLTRAMVDVGERLTWDRELILDKHCVGGLPGNRTTPIVVAILASLGFTIPKTSSRAITSPAGTADTMETLTPVDLTLEQMRNVVEREGACLAWGGAVRLSPADDILIRIERALDIDTEGQLIASVLSKKIAAGATHVVLDLPVGPTAKIRTQAAARKLADHLSEIAAEFGLQTSCLFTDGSQPVGYGIGPALEAHDVLAVLQNAPDAPPDLRQRALTLAGAAIELATGKSQNGEAIASLALEDGRAWAKFQAICEAQGGLHTPPVAKYTHVWASHYGGVLTHIDNRKISRLAKLAGAPNRKAAGIEMHVRLDDAIKQGQPLLTLHAEAQGELDYALEYAVANADMLEVKA